MLEIARLLGVEQGERFRTKKTYNEAVWWFDEKTLNCEYHGKYVDSPLTSACKLHSLVNGEDEIRKMPWRPHKGDEYWYVAWTDDGTILVHPEVWRDCFMDYLLLRSRNCFRTKIAAEASQYDVYEKYTGKRHPDDKIVY